jgi:hypothetical protein
MNISLYTPSLLSMVYGVKCPEVVGNTFVHRCNVLKK